MAYGKAPEEVYHVRIEVRLEANRGLQGRLHCLVDSVPPDGECHANCPLKRMRSR